MGGPLIISQFERFLENGFGSLVIEEQSLCYGLQAVGRCPYGISVRAMNHKRCVCASLAISGSKVGQCSNGTYLPTIIDRKPNIEVSEHIVQADAVAGMSTSGLHQQMNMVNVVAASDGNTVTYRLRSRR
jgi:hypothetical protein